MLSKDEYREYEKTLLGSSYYIYGMGLIILVAVVIGFINTY